MAAKGLYYTVHQRPAGIAYSWELPGTNTIEDGEDFFNGETLLRLRGI